MVEVKKGYIERSRLMEDLFHDTFVMGNTDFMEVIRRQPAADVVPVVYGRWVSTEPMVRSPFANNHHCSVCGQISRVTDYCPNCGAKMDLEEKK